MTTRCSFSSGSSHFLIFNIRKRSRDWKGLNAPAPSIPPFHAIFFLLRPLPPSSSCPYYFLPLFYSLFVIFSHLNRVFSPFLLSLIATTCHFPSSAFSSTFTSSPSSSTPFSILSTKSRVLPLIHLFLLFSISCCQLNQITSLTIPLHLIFSSMNQSYFPSSSSSISSHFNYKSCVIFPFVQYP